MHAAKERKKERKTERKKNKNKKTQTNYKLTCLKKENEIETLASYIFPVCAVDHCVDATLITFKSYVRVSKPFYI